jgi:ribosome-binding protein aMBF1 (putative translation factor)
MMTISVACPIASPLQGCKRGKPSPTKPMSLRGLPRNRTGNDSPWFGVRSRRRLTVTKAARGDIGAIFAHAVHERRESARQAGGWSQENAARNSGVSVPTIKRLEALDGVIGGRADTSERIVAALEAAGVIFIEENGGGPGVRLRKAPSGDR